VGCGSRDVTWMMKRKIGFLGSYSLGLDPSKIPPWGVARREEGEGAAAATDVVEDMVATGWLCAWWYDARSTTWRQYLYYL
jgi:hypothetical protein